MNDKQLSALLLLFVTAFLFWLYNTGRLQGVKNAIVGNSGGVDFNPLYNEQSPSFDYGGGEVQPVIPSGTVGPGKPVIDQFGNPVLDKNGNPVLYKALSFNNLLGSGLENGVNALNKWPVLEQGIMRYIPNVSGSLPDGIGRML